MKARSLLTVVAAGATLGIASGVFAQDIPRTADGKPDFSGYWGQETAPLQASVYQDGDAPPRLTRAEAAKALPLTDWGRAQVAYLTAADGEYGGETGAAEDPRFHRLCGEPKNPADIRGAIEIVQNPHRLTLVFTRSHPWIRQLWIGRKHPEDLTDYNSTWMGHSVASWESDTLVVDTVAIREGTLIDFNKAASQSGQQHMVERFQLLDRGMTMQVDRTFEDPVAYTEPWSDTKRYTLQTDWEQIAADWEIAETHITCEGGTYPTEHDPWFDNFDTIAEEILPNLERLEQGPPE